MRELTKQNAIFVKDNDGHDYCIHEDDNELFYNLLDKCEEEGYGPNLDKFTEKFQPIGMDPNYYRKLYLK